MEFRREQREPQRAQASDLSIAEDLMLSRGADVRLDPHVMKVLGGDRVVHGNQQYRGLAVYPHSFVVRIGSDGQPILTGDSPIEIGELSIVPELGVEDAVRAAFRHLQAGSNESCHTPHPPRFEKKRYRPRVRLAFPMTNRPTVVSPGPFTKLVQVNLVVFSRMAQPVLAWKVLFVVRRVADFTLVVGATGEFTGEVLYCATEAASAASANVYLFDPDEAAAINVPFPRPVTDYPPGIRPAVPFNDWIDKDETVGNNVSTKLGNKDHLVRAAKVPTGLRFTPAAGSDDEKIVNAFFLCNFLHDFFSLLGFDEAHRNFQQKNFTGAGMEGDRLLVFVVSTTQGNANMQAQNDGIPAELALGVWHNDQPPLIGKSTALDAGVVIHEYTHGVSQRLSGGVLTSGLQEPQPLALGEAWSDYFAITLQNYYRAPAPPRYTFAAYASQRSDGVRPLLYNAFTADLSRIGIAPFDDQHGAGSIFAAALIKMHDDLLGLGLDGVGPETGWSLVINSFKTLKANPTFIQARDAILEGIAGLNSPRPAQIEGVVRAAFAHFGMGRNARCTDTSFNGVTADFTP